MKNNSRGSNGRIFAFAVVLPVILCIVMVAIFFGASHKENDNYKPSDSNEIVNSPDDAQTSAENEGDVSENNGQNVGDNPVQPDDNNKPVEPDGNSDPVQPDDDNKPEHPDDATLPEARPSTPPANTGGDDGTRIDVDLDAWNLILVNPKTYLPEGFGVELAQYNDTQSVDERIIDDLKEMISAMKADGLSPVICSSYRTQEKQQTLFNNQVNRLINSGLSEEEAKKEAGTAVAIPGTSEHQTGLAVDIVALSYQILDEKQEETAEQSWLMEHCYDYGFILRYPNDKSEITGIIYEPWHYRYVGKEVAADIKSKGICFEEWLALYK